MFNSFVFQNLSLDTLALVFFILFIISVPLYIALKLIFIVSMLPIINLFCPIWVFNFRLNIAKKTRYYHYYGMGMMSEIRGYPQARVLYNDGKYSVNMAIGNAYDLASSYGGVVSFPENFNRKSLVTRILAS
jgi:hypothetical protein